MKRSAYSPDIWILGSASLFPSCQRLYSDPMGSLFGKPMPGNEFQDLLGEIGETGVKRFA